MADDLNVKLNTRDAKKEIGVLTKQFKELEKSAVKLGGALDRTFKRLNIGALDARIKRIKLLKTEINAASRALLSMAKSANTALAALQKLQFSSKALTGVAGAGLASAGVAAAGPVASKAAQATKARPVTPFILPAQTALLAGSIPTPEQLIKVSRGLDQVGRSAKGALAPALAGASISNSIASMNRLGMAVKANTASTSVFKRTVRDLGSDFISLGGHSKSSLATTSKGLQNAGVHARRFAGLLTAIGVAVGLSQTINTLSEFGLEISRVAAITNTAGEENRAVFAALERQARDLGATTIFTASQAASGMRLLAQAGFDAKEVLDAIPGTLNLAAAGMISLTDASDITANAVRGFGLAAEQATEVADILAVTATSANTDLLQLRDALKFVATPAAAVNQTLADVAAALGVLSDAGLKGTLAGTSLRRVFIGLTETNSIRKLQQYGFELEKLNPRFTSILDIVKELAGEGIELPQAVELFGVRGAPGILALVDQVKRLEDLTKATNDASGAAQRLADIILDNLAGDLRILLSVSQEAILTLGDAGLTGTLRGIAQTGAEVIRELAGIREPLAEVKGEFAASAEAISGIANAFRVFIRILLVVVGATVIGKLIKLLSLTIGLLGTTAGRITALVAVKLGWQSTQSELNATIERTNTLLEKEKKRVEDLQSLNLDQRSALIPQTQKELDEAIVGRQNIQNKIEEINEKIRKANQEFTDLLNAQPSFEGREQTGAAVGPGVVIEGISNAFSDLGSDLDRAISGPTDRLQQLRKDLISNHEQLLEREQLVARLSDDLARLNHERRKRFIFEEGKLRDDQALQFAAFQEQNAKAAEKELESLRAQINLRKTLTPEDFQLQGGLQQLLERFNLHDFEGFKEEVAVIADFVLQRTTEIEERLAKLRADPLPDQQAIDQTVTQLRSIQGVTISLEKQTEARKRLRDELTAAFLANEKLKRSEEETLRLLNETKSAIEAVLNPQEKWVRDIEKLNQLMPFLNQLITDEAQRLDILSRLQDRINKSREDGIKALEEENRQREKDRLEAPIRLRQQEEELRLLKARFDLENRTQGQPFTRGFILEATNDFQSDVVFLEDLGRDVARSLSDAFTNIFVDPMNALTNFKEALLELETLIIQRIIEQFVVGKLVDQFEPLLNKIGTAVGKIFGVPTGGGTPPAGAPPIDPNATAQNVAIGNLQVAVVKGDSILNTSVVRSGATTHTILERLITTNAQGFAALQSALGTMAQAQLACCEEQAKKFAELTAGGSLTEQLEDLALATGPAFIVGAGIAAGNIPGPAATGRDAVRNTEPSQFGRFPRENSFQTFSLATAGLGAAASLSTGTLERMNSDFTLRTTGGSSTLRDRIRGTVSEGDAGFSRTGSSVGSNRLAENVSIHLHGVTDAGSFRRSARQTRRAANDLVMGIRGRTS